MAVQPWKLLSENLVYNGYRKIAKRFYELPSGRRTNFDIQVEGPSVTVLAMTSDQQIIVIDQYRPGPNKVVVEFPGGGIDKGDDPLIAAKKELLEETGYAGDFQHVVASTTGSWSTQIRHTFVATNIKKIQEPTPGPNEFIELRFVSPQQLREIIKGGDFDGIESAYLGLDYLNLL
jgi:ADP-ribose pyrophosphatase